LSSRENSSFTEFTFGNNRQLAGFTEKVGGKFVGNAGISKNL